MTKMPTSSNGTERQLFPPRQRVTTTTTTTTFRFLVLAVTTGYFFQKTFHAQLYPWGSPVPWPDRRDYAPMDYTNDKLQAHRGNRIHRIYDGRDDGLVAQNDKGKQEETLIRGTETIVLDKDGNMFGMTEEAELILITDIQPSQEDEDATAGLSTKSTAKVSVVKSLGFGRPLGGAFGPHGHTLWIADAILGLTRLQNPLDPSSKVEFIANRVTLEDGTQSPLLYTNDVVVGPTTGKVYFTDSSTVHPTRVDTRTWDTLYASKVDAFRGLPTGRLLEYDPSTDQMKVLATGFRFLNGIHVSPDESFLVMAETFGPKIWKYHLRGPQAGQSEVLVSHMMGYPDGLSCAPDGRCFAAMPSSIVPLHKLVSKCPDSIDWILRNLIIALPRQLAPKVKPFGGVLQVNAHTGAYEYLLDPHGTHVAHFAGATYHDGKVYLGSLKNDYITVLTP